MTSEPRVTGVLLTYYGEYGASAVRRFEAFLSSISRRCHTVVVENGHRLVANEYPSAEIIGGDNRLREFSGWDKGLEHIHGSPAYDEADLFVFANDTFCHHNKFGPFTRRAFCQAFRQLARSPADARISGERFALGADFEIDGARSSGWISTYLFALSPVALRRLRTLSPVGSMDRFYRRDDGVLHLSEVVGTNLRVHIERWMGAGNGMTRWRGNADTSSAPGDLSRLQGKVNSILCEKLLSARASMLGIGMVDALAHPILRHARRAEGLVDRIGEAMRLRPQAKYER